MISNKVILTYKRKHASLNSNPANVDEGDAPLKSSRRILRSAASNDSLKGHHKVCKSHLYGCKGKAVDCCSCSNISECNDPSSEPTTQGRSQHVACAQLHNSTSVEQHDNERELIQQQLQEASKPRRSESGQRFEKDPAEKSINSTLHTEVSVGETVVNKDLDVASLDSRTAYANGSSHSKAGMGSPACKDVSVTVRSDPVPLDSAEKKFSSLCREGKISETRILSGNSLSSMEAQPTMELHKTVHKENFGSTLRTFCRRAKKAKDIGEREMCGNKLVRGDTSLSEQDSVLKTGGPRVHSSEVTLQAKGHTGSIKSLLNLNGDAMVKELHEDVTHGLVPGCLNENEKNKSKEGVAKCMDGSKVATEERKNFLEDRHVKATSNCYTHDAMKDLSSEVNHRDKQFKLPETSSIIGSAPEVGSIDALKHPIIKRMANDRLEVENPLIRRHFGPHLDINEPASSKITDISACETGNQVDDVSNENLIGSCHSSDGAIEDVSGSCEAQKIKKRLKQRVVCTVADIDNNYRLACSGDDTTCLKSAKSSPDFAIAGFLRGNISNTASSQKGHLVENKGNTVLESQLRTKEAGSICKDFLSSTHIQHENVEHPIKDFQSTSPLSRLKSTGYAHELQLPWQTSDSNSSMFRHKQILDDILTGSRMLNKRHENYFANFRRHPRFWSDEELDSLWVGVRRHGRGNWNAMLGDPKLHFAGWRIAEDLAERWDMEQSKLLNPLVQPMRSLEADHSLSSIISNRLLSNSAVDSYHRSYLSEIHNSRNETGLSLGDVFLKKEGKNNRIPIQLPDFTVHPLAANGSFAAGSSYSYRGQQGHILLNDVVTHPRPGKSLETHDLIPSLLEQNLVERLPDARNQMATLSSTNNLPHWLKEVLVTPAAPNEQAKACVVSTFGPVVSLSPSREQQVIPPFSYPSEKLAPVKDARRGILKRRGTKSVNTSITSTSALRSAECKASDTVILDLNQSSSEAIEQNNLVILDGDASSEETISDDQGSRH